jgi:hypothetical protein
MTDLFGQAAVPASRFPLPERARRPMTNVICGLRGFLSSESAALQESLVSRLKRQLDGVGSTLFSLTWRRKATPAHRPYYQLAVSARRTSDSDCGSWPTPCQQDGPKGGPSQGTDRLPAAASLASWPTPTEMDAASSGAAGYSTESGRHSGTTLTDPARSSWPTPTLHDAERGGQEKRASTERHGSNLQDFALTAWPTPAATDAKMVGSGSISWLQERGKKGIRLNDHVVHRGPISSGSPAATARRGQLNPAFSRWLQGYPEGWDACAPTVTRSSRKSQQSSSGRLDDDKPKAKKA